MCLPHAFSLREGNLQTFTGMGTLPLPRLFVRIKRSVHNRYCRLKVIWADGAYAALSTYVRQPFGGVLEVVRRPTGAKGFTVLPRRWVVERSCGWFGRYRRLCRDFEPTTSSSEAVVYLASIRRTLKLVTTEKPN
jgi:putative transposase